jgi:hypothetical protein
MADQVFCRVLCTSTETLCGQPLHGVFSCVGVLDIAFAVLRLLNTVVLLSQPDVYPSEFCLATVVACLVSIVIAATAVAGLRAELYSRSEGLRLYKSAKSFEVGFVVVWGVVQLVTYCDWAECSSLSVLVSWSLRVLWSVATAFTVWSAYTQSQLARLMPSK